MSAAHPNLSGDEVPDTTTVGVRDLRHNLSDYLRRVKAGETIIVTDRGEPIANLVPVPHEPVSFIEEEIRAGRATAPPGWPDHDRAWPPPLKLTREQLGGKLVSEILQEMRDGERY